MIMETDNGDPVCIDGFINEVKRRLSEKDPDITNYLRSVAPNVLEVFQRWETQPFAIHDMYIGDAAELIHAGNITGIGQHYHSGSGTGLLAVRYLAEAHGGKVLYTQSYKTGGPIFGVLLPKDPAKANPAKLEEALKLAKAKDDYKIEMNAA